MPDVPLTDEDVSILATAITTLSPLKSIDLSAVATAQGLDQALSVHQIDVLCEALRKLPRDSGLESLKYGTQPIPLKELLEGRLQLIEWKQVSSIDVQLLCSVLENNKGIVDLIVTVRVRLHL
jgi:hypothetical protein